MSTIINALFNDADNFSTIAEAEVVSSDLMDDILDVQYPDSKRGIGRSRADINNRVQKFVARCKLNQLKADTNDKAKWKEMGTAGVKMQAELRRTKDAVQMIEGIW